VVRRARSAATSAGNSTTGIRAIQTPFNPHSAGAFTKRIHQGRNRPQSTLWFAADAGLSVFVTDPIASDPLPRDVASRISGQTTIQKNLNFARSAPGVTSVLMPASTVESLQEAIAAGHHAPIGAESFDEMFE
ncbi:MAG: aldo/keto reductase, partial [Halobacteriaceae archaeon]